MISPPNFEEWLNFGPFDFAQNKKELIQRDALISLTRWHSYSCEAYKRIIRLFDIELRDIKLIEEIPYIPVRLLKEFSLLSIPKKDVFKTMTSSGTTGSQFSKIYLDRYTASLQTKALSRIMSYLIGPRRIPMLIIDSPNVLKSRDSFSARGAGIRGFSMFGQNVTYALDEKMCIDMKSISNFLSAHKGQPIFIFGFTFMIWRYFVLPLLEMGEKVSLEQGFLLHGGGWKKLNEGSVDSQQFSSVLRSLTRVRKVVNYYGMVEQTGSIAIECESGNFHSSIYSDVVVRRSGSFVKASYGEEGLIETLSILPRSYPGHALLTEDLGVVLGEDDCPCGLSGKYFRVLGRVARAEVRGCSDTQETLNNGSI